MPMFFPPNTLVSPIVTGPILSPTSPLTLEAVTSANPITIDNNGIISGNQLTCNSINKGGGGNTITLGFAGAATVTGAFGINGNAAQTKTAAITTPNTQTASYVQADVASLKTAIDAIRVAIQAIGITA